MRILITGGCGFIGSNLAHASIQRGDEVFVFDDLSRDGSRENLAWLKAESAFEFYENDVRDADAVAKAVAEAKPDVIFHMAGQVAMTTSIANPRRDFEVNVLGGFNLLEATRTQAPNAVVVYSSTNKVYGGLEQVRLEETATRYVTPDFPNGFAENTTLDFQSPYGCSKGAVDQYMLDYARLFGLRTIVFRHSTVFGGRQFATFDQGWMGWFTHLAVKASQGATQPFTIAGTGKQVRDVLFISDLLDCYFDAVKAADKTAGQAYNIGGGAKNSLSLLELFALLEKELGLKLQFTREPWRVSDQKVFIADTGKARAAFGFAPKIDKETGVRRMIEWTRSR